jgi:hypothetical protein
VSNSHATEVDTSIAAMNGGKPSKATFEQFDRPPRLAELDRARGSLDLDELNCAVATWPALAASLADGSQLQGVVQLPVAAGLFLGNRETVGFLQQRDGLHPCGKAVQPPLRRSCEAHRAGRIPLGRRLIRLTSEHIRDDDGIACFMAPFHRPVGPMHSNSEGGHVGER